MSAPLADDELYIYIYISYHFPSSIFLVEPFDSSLRRSWYTLQKRAASLHTKLHRFLQPLLHCGGRKPILDCSNIYALL